MITRKETLPIHKPGQLLLFAEKTFENRLLAYFDKTHQVQVQIDWILSHNAHRTITFTGKSNAVDRTYKDLLGFISRCRTKIFDAKTGEILLFSSVSKIVPDPSSDNRWINIGATAALVIQHQLNQVNKVCVCESQTSPLSIQVHYIDQPQSELGLDERTIDAICQQQLKFAECTLSPSNRYANEWNSVTTSITTRVDYGKDICLDESQGKTSLYGLPILVTQYQKKLEAINEREKASQVESRARAAGVLSKPEKIEKPVLKSTHEPVVHRTENIPIPPTYSITFDVDQPGFEVLVDQELPRLLAIFKSKVFYGKQIIDHPIQIDIPKARVDDIPDQSEEQTTTSTTVTPVPPTAPKDNWFVRLFQSAKPQPTPSKSEQLQPVRQAMPNHVTQPCLAIRMSKITICTGDLTTQQVSQKFSFLSNDRLSA